MTITRQNYGFRFRDWDIYKDSRIFRSRINIILRTYPSEEKYALVDQTKRALNSILLAIAEGANKNSDKEMRVYINRAHTSLDEVVACLDCALDDGYIKENQHGQALVEASSLAKRLSGFNSYLSGQQSQLESMVKRYATGFTVIELLVAISIMAILSTVSIANFRRGEQSRGVGVAFDTINNAVRNAQNFALTSRVIANSSCKILGVDDHAPKSYLVVFPVNQTITLYGIDKCSTSNSIESYTLPKNIRIQANGYKLNTGSGLTPVSTLQIMFTPPFGKIFASSDSSVNEGTFNSFVSATITAETSDGTLPKTVTVDGLSGRIGE